MTIYRTFLGSWMGDDSYLAFDEGEGDISVYSVLFIQEYVGKREEPNEDAVWVDDFYMHSSDREDMEKDWLQMISEDGRDEEIDVQTVSVHEKAIDLVINRRLNYIHREESRRFEHVDEAVKWFTNDFAQYCDRAEELKNALIGHFPQD